MRRGLATTVAWALAWLQCVPPTLAAPSPAAALVAPDVTLLSPASDLVTNRAALDVTVAFTTAKPGPGQGAQGNVTLIQLLLDGAVVAEFTNPPQVKAGTHTFPAVDLSAFADTGSPVHLAARAFQGNPQANLSRLSAPVSVLVDTLPPVLDISQPTEGAVLATASVPVTLTYRDAVSGVDPATLTVLLNGEPRTAQFTIGASSAHATLTLTSGMYDLTATISDRAGHQAARTRHFMVETGPVVPPNAGFIHGLVVQAGTDQPLADAVITLEGPGSSVRSGADGTYQFPVPGSGVFDLNIQKPGFTSVQRRVQAFAGRDVAVEPAMLTPLDPQVTLITPALGGLATDSSGTFQVEFPPGAAPHELPVRITPLADEQQLPGPLQEEEGHIAAVYFEPRFTTFNTPATLRVRNSLGLPPGTEVNLQLWQEDEQGWRDVEPGQVTADGAWLEFRIIRFFCWYCIWLRRRLPERAGNPNPQQTTTVTAAVQDPGKGCDVRDQSAACLSSGSLSESHTLPSLRTLGASRTLAFTYRSSAASPSVLIGTDYVLDEAGDAATATPATTSATIHIEGRRITASFAGSSGPLRQAFLWDGVNARGERVLTGAYPYTVTIFNQYDATLGDTGLPAIGRSTLPTTVKSHAVLVNERASPFGAGWSLEGLERLFPQPDGTVLVTDGDGSATVFRPEPNVDVAVASSSANDVSVLSGHGDGTFQPPQRLPIGVDPPVITDSPIWVATGDFNEDGRQDLAAALNRSGETALLLGLGRATFTPPMRIAVDTGPTWVAAAELNRDGHGDLVVINQSAGSVSILLGHGDGTFQPPLQVAVGQSPTRGAIGDVNRDGIPDVVVANQGASDLSVLLGNGDGTFQTERRALVDSNPLSVAMADVNRDGAADLAVAYGGFRNVALLLGNGDGTFQPQMPIASGSHSFSDLAAGDVDGDANADLVVTTGRAAVIVLRGVGDGTFHPPQELAVAGPSFAVILSDLNQDGFQDLAATATNGAVSLLLGNGDGTFQRQRRLPVGIDVLGLVVGEFDGRRGDPDQVFSGLPGDFSQLRRHPDGTFERLLTNGTRRLFDARGFHTATIDRNEHETRYLYNAQDRLRRVEVPGGAAFDLAYNPADGHLVSVTDSAGRTTQMVVDGTGDLQRITNPDGAARRFTYDAEHRLLSQANERGFTTEYVYDGFGRLQEASLPERLTFDPVTGTVSFQREVRHFTPSETQGLINVLPAGVGTPDNPAPAVPTPRASFQDASGNRIQLLTDHFGAPTQLIDPLGRTTVIERDINGLPVRVTSPTGAQTLSIYDSRGNLTFIAQRPVPLPNLPALPIVNRFEYEPRFSQVTRIVDARRDDPLHFPSFCPSGCTTTTDYDAHGNPIAITDGAGARTEFTYDSRGLLITVTDALGTQTPAIPDDHQTRFTYDPVTGNLLTTTDPLLRPTELTYDAFGNVETSKDAALRLTTFTYDVLSRLRTVRDALGQTTTYDYDAVGNLLRVTDAKTQATQFEYDSLNLLSRTTNPLNQVREFFYDLNRNLSKTLDAKGQTSTFTYDAANQLTGKVLRDTLGVIQDTVTYAYDSLGNLTLVQDTDSTLTFEYDSIGRLLKAGTGESGNPAFAQPVSAIDYTYDLAGNRTMLTSPFTLSPRYAYDAANRVTGINAQNLLAKTFEYDALGRLTRLAGGGGTQTLFTYDAASQLLTLRNLMLGTEVAPADYTYDALGNRQTLTDRLGLHQYAYDALSRLTSADHALASGLVDEAFSYDPVGNRLTSHLSASHLHDAANRLLEDETFTYTYDANGNLTSKREKATNALTTYTYDGENQLIQIDFPDGTTATYRYDGLGRRIEKDVAGVVTRFLYDQEDIVTLLDGTNCPTHVVLHGPGIDQPLGFLRDTNADCDPFNLGGFREPILDLLPDGLGTLTSLTTEIGGFFRTVVLAERTTTDSFGTPRITGPGPDGQLDTGDDVTLPASALGNPFLFTGREYDSESGLYYYRSRYYDPRTGRFLQEDPFPGFLYAPLTLNRYPYVLDNPINRTDPNGKLSSSLVALLISGVVTLTFLTLFILGTQETMRKADEFRQRQKVCKPEDLERAMEADKLLQELAEEEAIPKVRLGIGAAQITQMATPADAAVSLGQELGAVIGGVLNDQ